MCKSYERKMSGSVSWEDQLESLKLDLEGGSSIEDVDEERSRRSGEAVQEGQMAHSLAETLLAPSKQRAEFQEGVRSSPRERFSLPSFVLCSFKECSGSQLSLDDTGPCHSGRNQGSERFSYHIPDGSLLLMSSVAPPMCIGLAHTSSLKVKTRVPQVGDIPRHATASQLEPG